MVGNNVLPTSLATSSPKSNLSSYIEPESQMECSQSRAPSPIPAQVKRFSFITDSPPRLTELPDSPLGHLDHSFQVFFDSDETYLSSNPASPVPPPKSPIPGPSNKRRFALNKKRKKKKKNMRDNI